MEKNKYYVVYKKIDRLEVGFTFDRDIFTSEGSLLFSNGHSISKEDLLTLKSRIDNFVFHETDVMPGEKEREMVSTEDINPDIDNHIDNREISSIPFGKEGLNLLVESDIVKYLNKLQLRDTKLYLPTNPEFRNSITDLAIGDRDREYKEWINNHYTSNLTNFRQTMIAIANGETKNIDRIKLIVKSFISIFRNDKTMLVNLASSNSGDGEYIFKHSFNVCLLVIGFATQLGYDEVEVEEIAISALLSDIGMLFISDEIRKKDEMLNNREWYEIKKHPLLTVEICRKLNNVPKVALFVALQIHEKINGSGYPQGISNIMIHPYTKIVQICDIYDALISERPYRKEHSPFEAIEILLKLANNRSLERKMAIAFIQYISIFPIGTLVKLSDSRIGKVIATNNTDLKRPKLSIVIDSMGNRIDPSKAYVFDLAKNSGIKIEQSISVSLFNNIDIMDGF